ncbi:hypothetical protein MMC29_001354 [Sticta canariensis]|nr:hypothetical protein [Sticta canariensis]
MLFRLLYMDKKTLENLLRTAGAEILPKRASHHGSAQRTCLKICLGPASTATREARGIYTTRQPNASIPLSLAALLLRAAVANRRQAGLLQGEMLAVQEQAAPHLASMLALQARGSIQGVFSALTGSPAWTVQGHDTATEEAVSSRRLTSLDNGSSHRACRSADEPSVLRRTQGGSIQRSPQGKASLHQRSLNAASGSEQQRGTRCSGGDHRESEQKLGSRPAAQLSQLFQQVQQDRDRAQVDLSLAEHREAAAKRRLARSQTTSRYFWLKEGQYAIQFCRLLCMQLQQASTQLEAVQATGTALRLSHATWAAAASEAAGITPQQIRTLLQQGHMQWLAALLGAARLLFVVHGLLYYPYVHAEDLICLQAGQQLFPTTEAGAPRTAAAIAERWEAAVARASSFAQAASSACCQSECPVSLAYAAGKVPHNPPPAQSKACWYWQDAAGQEQVIHAASALWQICKGQMAYSERLPQPCHTWLPGPYCLKEIRTWHEQGHLHAHVLLYLHGLSGQARRLTEVLSFQHPRAHIQKHKIWAGGAALTLSTSLQACNILSRYVMHMFTRSLNVILLQFAAVSKAMVGRLLDAFRLDAQRLALECIDEGITDSLQDALTTLHSAMQASLQKPADASTSDATTSRAAERPLSHAAVSLETLPPPVAQQWSQGQLPAQDAQPQAVSALSELSPEQKAAQLLQAFGYAAPPSSSPSPSPGLQQAKTDIQACACTLIASLLNGLLSSPSPHNRTTAVAAAALPVLPPSASLEAASSKRSPLLQPAQQPVLSAEVDLDIGIADRPGSAPALATDTATAPSAEHGSVQQVKSCSAAQQELPEPAAGAQPNEQDADEPESASILDAALAVSGIPAAEQAALDDLHYACIGKADEAAASRQCKADSPIDDVATQQQQQQQADAVGHDCWQRLATLPDSRPTAAPDILLACEPKVLPGSADTPGQRSQQAQLERNAQQCRHAGLVVLQQLDQPAASAQHSFIKTSDAEWPEGAQQESSTQPGVTSPETVQRGAMGILQGHGPEIRAAEDPFTAAKPSASAVGGSAAAQQGQPPLNRQSPDSVSQPQHTSSASASQPEPGSAPAELRSELSAQGTRISNVHMGATTCSPGRQVAPSTSQPPPAAPERLAAGSEAGSTAAAVADAAATDALPPQQPHSSAPTAVSPRKGKRGRPAAASSRSQRAAKSLCGRNQRKIQHSSPSAPAGLPQAGMQIPQVPTVDLWQGDEPAHSPPCSPSRPAAFSQPSQHMQTGNRQPSVWQHLGAGPRAEGQTGDAASQQAAEEAKGRTAGTDSAEVGSRHVTPASEASCSTELPEAQLAALQVTTRSMVAQLGAVCQDEAVLPEPGSRVVHGSASSAPGPKHVKRAIRAALQPALTAVSQPAAGNVHSRQCISDNMPGHTDASAAHQGGPVLVSSAELPNEGITVIADNAAHHLPAESLQQQAGEQAAAQPGTASQHPHQQQDERIIIPPDDHPSHFFVPISERVKRQRKPSAAAVKLPLAVPLISKPKPRRQSQAGKAGKPATGRKHSRQPQKPARAATPEPKLKPEPKRTAAQNTQQEQMRAATCTRARGYMPGQTVWSRSDAEGVESPRRARIRVQVAPPIVIMVSSRLAAWVNSQQCCCWCLWLAERFSSASLAAPAAEAPPITLPAQPQERRSSRASRALAEAQAENPLLVRRTVSRLHSRWARMWCNAHAKDLRPWRSKLHGWGLVANEPIPPHCFVMEYIGEVVRNLVSDRREREYDAVGLGSCYMFRLDAERVVDATRKLSPQNAEVGMAALQGGLARFINHSCNPNCFTKIVTLNGDKHIVINSKRGIAPGEELTYDYKVDPCLPLHCIALHVG